MVSVKNKKNIIELMLDSRRIPIPKIAFEFLLEG